MLQMLQKIQNQRVHIINLGFKSEWIMSSFKKTRPDKVYLVKRTNESKDAKDTEKEIKKFTKKFGIELIILKNDEDIYKLIKQLKVVFEEEKGNMVYLAISSGPRYNTSAFIISSMLFGKYSKEVYLYSLKEGEFIPLPHFETKLPKLEVIEAIKFISKEGKCKKKKLRDFIFNESILQIGKECKDKEHAMYVKLNRSILESALDWKLIKIDGKKKGCLISLTEEGEKWVKIF